ncbi:P-loop containing nucleoside triphosphate hydrolase protein [Naviculisporaceae sp. PSN 640]
MGQQSSKPVPAASSSSVKSGKESVLSAEPEVVGAPAVPDIGPDDLVIAVMGLTGVGKSTFISHFSDTAVVGDDLKSCTATISIHTGQVDDKTIYLIDTPGFDDTSRTDTEILREIATWLERSYDADIKLAGIVYLHRIQDNRVGGSGVKNIQVFRELCGTEALSSVVLATTMWDALAKEKAEEREQELKTKPEFWGTLVEHGCTVLRQDDGAESAKRIIRHIVEARSQKIGGSGLLQIQEEIMVDGKELHETAAGTVLKEELEEKLREHAAKTASLEAELAELQRILREEREREQKEWEKRDIEQRDAEKRERAREEEISGLNEKLNRLAEDLKSTRERQEKVEAEYTELKQKTIWDWCAVM